MAIVAEDAEQLVATLQGLNLFESPMVAPTSSSRPSQSVPGRNELPNRPLAVGANQSAGPSAPVAPRKTRRSRHNNMHAWVVFVGRRPGVYDDWETGAEPQTKGFSGARHRAVKSREEGEVVLRAFELTGRVMYFDEALAVLQDADA